MDLLSERDPTCTGVGAIHCAHARTGGLQLVCIGRPFALFAMARSLHFQQPYMAQEGYVRLAISVLGWHQQHGRSLS